MKTFSAKADTVDRKWWVIDAKGQILGEVAVEAARLLRGKHKPIIPDQALKQLPENAAALTRTVEFKS